MKERPILFSAPMVRAILAGYKVQTRRPMNPQPVVQRINGGWDIDGVPRFMGTPEIHLNADQRARWAGQPKPWCKHKCPYGQPGDRLWVKETWRRSLGKSGDLLYAADFGEYELRNKGPWRPSIYMPRSISRIVRPVVDVRIERVMDISEEDAKAEGLARWARGESEWAWGLAHRDDRGPLEELAATHAQAFGRLWSALNDKRAYAQKRPIAWVDNPWVWVVTVSATEQT